jgi:fumarate reductase subunit C
MKPTRYCFRTHVENDVIVIKHILTLHSLLIEDKPYFKLYSEID